MINDTQIILNVLAELKAAAEIKTRTAGLTESLDRADRLSCDSGIVLADRRIGQRFNR